MRKPLLISVAVALLLIGGGIVVYSVMKSSPDEPATANMTAEQAIEAAKHYQPPDDMMCITVMTPAVHTETGAAYTFPSGCLPSGWTHSPADASSPRDSGERAAQKEPTADILQPDDAAAVQLNLGRSEGNRPPQGHTPDSAPTPQEQVIAEARAFQPPPGTMCTTVMTPALHVETGARYTFGYGCLPPGWIAQRGSEL